MPIGIELLPEWRPSGNPGLARFDVLVKASGGHVVQLSDLRLELLDASGAVVDFVVPALEEGTPPLAGPAWRDLRGRHVRVGAGVTAAAVTLSGARSRTVERDAWAQPVSLVAIRDVLGMPHEPRLWWRYHNAGAEAVEVADIERTTVVWVDEVPLTPRTAYNGPATVPPGRALSGLWSLEDLTLGPHAGAPLAPHAGRGHESSGKREHRIRLQIDGHSSADVVLEADTAGLQ